MTTTNTPEHANHLHSIQENITNYLHKKLADGTPNLTDENLQELTIAIHATIDKYLYKLEDNKISVLDIIGNLYTSAATCKYLNITQEELDKLVEDHLILKLTDGKGRNGYPLFQFTNNTIDPNTQQLIKLYLDHENDPWSTAITLTTPTRAYDENNSSRIEYIRAHPDKYPLVYAQEKHDVKERYYWDGRPNKN